MWQKIINFVTGGLPSEIAKQVGEHFNKKTEKEIKEFEGDLAYDLKVLDISQTDKLCTRQGIAWTFHIFMWASKLITGAFPNDIIFQWGDTVITIGLVYVMIIVAYYPLRSVEKLKKLF